MRDIASEVASINLHGVWPIPESHAPRARLLGKRSMPLRLALVGLPLILLCVGAASYSQSLPADLQGDIYTHDPSMIRQGKTYYVFSTGSPNGSINHGNIQIRVSDDRIRWHFVNTVFEEIPTWIINALGTRPRSLWAPDISYFNGKYHLYYAGSLFGTNNSVIGLATNRTLDPTSPDYKWIDEGLIIRSATTDSWNAIDPNLSFDAKGAPWLSFGSFFSGIKLRRIDSRTGKLSASDTTLYSLAARPGVGIGGAIEAPTIIYHQGYYYLFVSFDFCCRGVKSDYKIMVGRAKSITGPYLDQQDKRMDQGGGSLILAGDEHYIGPGGQSVYRDGKTFLLVHHYYDALEKGRAKLQINELRWTDAGWPVVLQKSN